METFKLIHVEPTALRTELHDALGLTGCEASINVAPAGFGVPFVHAHTANEELYGILSGDGELFLDGKIRSVSAGDWFRIAPEAHRALRAAATSPMTYICVQCSQGSLKGFTATDAKICEEKAPWMR